MKHLLHNNNKSVCFLLLLLLAVSFCYGETYVIDTTVPREAVLNVISESSSEIVLEFTFGSIEIDSVEIDNQYWKTAAISGCGLISEAGNPELPQFSDWIRVPWLNTQVEILEKDRIDRLWGQVQPAPETMMRDASESFRRIPNKAVYNRSRFFPSLLSACDVGGQLSKTGVALITFTPVQVNSITGEWRIHSRIRVRLTGTRRGNLDELQSDSYSANLLLNTITRNPGQSGLDEISDEPRLLLVTNSQYVAALQPFIEWKNQCGIPVETIIYSNVAASPDQLRNHLIARIDACTVPPEFLLIVGDVDVIPGFFGVDNSLTDHPYSTLNTGDYLPDISVGRIPCVTTTELSQWVERLLVYERDGVIPDYINATAFSSNVSQDPQHGDDVTNLFSSSGLVVNHLQQPQSGTLTLLMNALNQNPLWAFYIGHGYSQAWSSVGPDFQVSDLPEIEHSASTIVVSVACATADLDYPGGSIAEEWFNKTLNSGLLAYIGATESTAFYRSDTIGIAALYGAFVMGVERLGPALDYGKLRCAESFPQLPGGQTEETIQQFILLGDPSMRVFTGSPQAIQVTHAHTLPVGSTTLPVSVGSNGQALANAEICLQGEDIYSVVRTGASGSAELEFAIDQPATLLLTVTARNATAYQSEIQLVPNDAPFVIVDSIAILDTEGDEDGRADRGESCELLLTVTNIGSQSSSPGELQLTHSEAEIHFLQNSVSVPALAANETRTLNQAIGFVVGSNIIDGTTVTLDLDVSESTGAATSSMEQFVLHAPNIEYSRCELIEIAGDNDGNPEAGETLALDLFLTNVGSDCALPMIFDFHTSPNYLIIHETRVVTDTIREGDAFSVRFIFNATDTTPRGYPFEFYVDITGSNIDTQQVWDSQRVGQVPVLLYERDLAPAQIDALEGCFVSLGIEYERMTQLPLNLFRYRSIWIFCGIGSNAQALPQSLAGRLTDYLDGGGNCYWEGGDVWSYDSETTLHPYFNIEGLFDGSSNAGPIEGEYGTSYQDYYFEYSGENDFIDQLGAIGGASVILRNDVESQRYAVCVANAGDGYRTIGSSIEIGLLDDAAYPSTRVHLIADMLAWFGIESRADIYPPVIRHTPLSDFLRRDTPIPILADVQDATGIESVVVRYRVNEGAETSVAMNLVDGLYRCALPGMPWNTTIHYRIEATDASASSNNGSTEEYEFRVRYEPDYTIDIYHYYGFQRSITPRIDKPKGASWSFTKSDNGQEVLELHDGSAQDMITYTTQIVECSALDNVRLKFWNYLRSGTEDHGVIARVLGSRDGGKTFPYVVWHRVQESAPILEEGIAVSEILDWIEADDRVAFRFETNTGWYWRIGEMQLVGDVKEELVPVSNLTIRPYRGGVKLFWNSLTDVLSYRVYMATVNHPDAFKEYVELQDSSYVDLESFTLAQRYYQVFAVIREAKRSDGIITEPTVSPASLGAADIRWNVRKNRQSR